MTPAQLVSLVFLIARTPPVEPVNALKVFFIQLKLDEMVDLDQLFKCNITWIFQNVHIEMPLQGDTDASGLYTCLRPAGRMFVTVVEKKLSLVNDMVGPVPITRDFTLTCHVMYFPSNAFFMNSLSIVNGTVKVAERSENSSDFITQLEHPLTVKAKLAPLGPGVTLFSCLWNMTVDVDDTRRWHVHEVRRVVEVFAQNVPAAGTRAIDSEVFPNEIVTCRSKGHPPPTYIWICQGENWSSKGPRLEISKPGIAKCTCTATNVIDGISHTDKWEGEILVISTNGDSENSGVDSLLQERRGLFSGNIERGLTVIFLVVLTDL